MSYIGTILNKSYFASPISRIANNGYRGELFNKFSGETLRFDSEDEFVQALAKLEEDQANERKERVRADLLLASAGSPDAIKRIFANTRKTVQGIVVDDYNDNVVRDSMIKDAVRAEARSVMTLADLKRYAREFPELQSLVTAKEADIVRNQARLNVVC